MIPARVPNFECVGSENMYLLTYPKGEKMQRKIYEKVGRLSAQELNEDSKGSTNVEGICGGLY